MKYKRILLKLSGESLMGDKQFGIDNARLKQFSNDIKEILDTGKLKILEEYIDKTPKGVIEMLKINGLGPSKIKILWKPKIYVENIKETLLCQMVNQ